MSFQTGLYINGQYVPSSTGATLTVLDPKDGSSVTDQAQVAGSLDVENAVIAAETAFPGWKRTPAAQRSKMMNKLADLLEAHTDELAYLESCSMGQPISLAKRMITGAIGVWRYYAGYAGKLAGEAYPSDADGLYKIVQYEPLGVCVGICAWNASHSLAAWKVAPAVAVGNTFVLKSSEKSPLSLGQYGRFVTEAGFPPGVINIVTGDGRVGSLLAGHMRIAKIAFTGSERAGREVQLAAARSNLKKVTLELGGKSPALIFEDADIPNAVAHSSEGFLRNSGQICFASSRILVQDSIATPFIQAIKVAFEEASERMGDPLQVETTLGPLADKLQFDRVMAMLDVGKAEGTEILVGGNQKGENGTFVEPTIVVQPDLRSKLYTDEIFGPVITVTTFKNEEEAIRLANDTPYGLGSSIYTSDITRALRIAGQLEAGSVGINGAFATSPQTPFGGWKQSGYGRELGTEGLKAYVQAKTIHINMSLPG